MPRIPLQIITPEKIAWEGEVDSLVVPAHDGQLGILHGHAPLLAQLTPGSLQISSQNETRLWAVSGGFVEVAGGRVSVFAETAEMSGEIDAERARQAVEKAKADLKRRTSLGEPDEQTTVSLRRALVRLRVAEQIRRRPPSSRPPSSDGHMG